MLPWNIKLSGWLETEQELFRFKNIAIEARTKGNVIRNGTLNNMYISMTERPCSVHYLKGQDDILYRQSFSEPKKGDGDISGKSSWKDYYIIILPLSKRPCSNMTASLTQIDKHS